MDVVIVGAGNAGLAALHTLRKQGVDAVCLEAKAMAGGRTITVSKNGFLFDFGSQFLFKYNRRFFDLCREMGLAHDITPWAGLVFFKAREQMVPAMVGATPKDLWKNRAKLKGMHKVLSPKAALQLLKMAPLIAAKVRAGGLDFVDYQASLDMDYESFSETCLRRGGREVLEGLFQPNLSAMTLGMPEEVSAPYGLALFWQSSQGYWTLKHGIGTLNEKIYQTYQDHVKLSTPVKKIVIEKGKVKGVETKEGLIKAKAVICCTTATTALKLMPNLPESLKRPMELAKYSACCHVIFATGTPVLKDNFYAVGLPRSSGSIFAGYTNSAVKSEYYAPAGCGLINCFTFDRHAVELNRMNDEKVKEICLKEVQRFSPGMPDHYEFCEIYRWDEAVNLCPPGMLSAAERVKNEHYRDVAGLFLAGDYLYMPSVDSSIHSGIVAAQAALR